MGLLSPGLPPRLVMPTQDGESTAAYIVPSRHDDITSGCNQTSSHQGGAAAAPTNKRDKKACGTSIGISQKFSQRVCSYRRASKRMISRDWFDQAVVGLILVNCFFLALDDPTLEASTYTITTQTETWVVVRLFSSNFVIMVAPSRTFLCYSYGGCMRPTYCNMYVASTDAQITPPS